MTHPNFPQELKEKVKAGVKPSHLKKSKSADNIPTSSSANPPLPRSKSQLEIPFSQPSPQDQQISSLQDELTIERKRTSLLRADLNQAQQKNKQLKAKINQLEDHILQLRLDKIKEFSDYYQQKQDLAKELNENITTGTQEIQRLENKLLTVQKKKLELQQQLGQQLNKSAQLERQLLTNPAPTFNYWPLLALALLIILATWLLQPNKYQK